MSRSFPVWIMASALAAFVGCGGGAATDSGPVASNSSDEAPASGGAAAPASGGDAAPASGGAAMPTGGSGMGTPGGSGMGTLGGGATASLGGAEMPSSAGGGAPAAATTPGAYGAGGYPGGATTGTDPSSDPAAISAAYGAGTAGDLGGELGGGSAVPEATAAANAAGAELGAGTTSVATPKTINRGASGAGANATSGAEVADPGGEYSGAPGAGGGAVEEKVAEGFEGEAQLAFRRGKEKDAMQFLYAHALTTEAGAENLLPTIRWVGGLRQPKLAVRWGAGFVVTAPRNFDGDPKPVGSQQTLPTRDGNRKGGAGNPGNLGGGGGDVGAGGASGGNGGNNSLLAKGAGELGEKLIAAYTERVTRGDFGEVLKKATETSSGGTRGNAGGNGASGYGGAGFGAAGNAGPGSGAKAGPESGGGGGAAAGATVATQLMPGLSMLGVGTQKELIERARADDIDAVVIIDMKLRVNTSNGLVTNDSTLSLLDAKTQKKLHTTKKFNNITIQIARAAGKDDGVDKELEALFEAIDANFKMTDLPAGLSAEIAAKRVAALAEEKHDNPLPILAEARMYHTKGLLEESALFAAYEKILGVDFGRQLATGEEEDKKKVLNRWLPES